MSIDSSKRYAFLRLLAIIPTLFLLLSFILQLLVVISGLQAGQLESLHLMTFNTSHLGENLIQIKPASSNTLVNRQDNPFNPFGLPPTTASASGLFPQATSAFGSAVSSGLASPTGSGLPGIPGLPTFNGLSTLSGFITTSMSLVLGGLLSTVLASVDGDITKAEAKLVHTIKTNIGLQDYYSMHLMAVCSGNLSSAADSGAKSHVKSCTTYQELISKFKNTSTTSVPNSFNVVGSNVSVPVLANAGPALDEMQKYARIMSGLNKALHIISLIGTVSTTIVSAAAVVLGVSNVIARTAAFSSLLSLFFQSLSAIIFTLIVNIVSQQVNKFGGSVDLYAKRGDSYAAATWVAFTLILIAALYWNVIWFIETRETSFARRLRTGDQKGNWNGIIAEVRSDLKIDPTENALKAELELKDGISWPSTRPRGYPMRRRSTYTRMMNVEERL